MSIKSVIYSLFNGNRMPPIPSRPIPKPKPLEFTVEIEDKNIKCCNVNKAISLFKIGAMLIKLSQLKIDSWDATASRDGYCYNYTFYLETTGNRINVLTVPEFGLIKLNDLRICHSQDFYNHIKAQKDKKDELIAMETFKEFMND